MFSSFYYGLLAGGGIATLIGIAIVILSIKFIRTNRRGSITTGVFLVVVGAAIFGLTLTMPSPNSQATMKIKMLNLDPQLLTTLSVYSENALDHPITQTNDKALLEEWASLLKSCVEFQPNHPHYEKIYQLYLKYKDGNFLYDVSFDSNNPNTADLTLLQTVQNQNGFYHLGNYRCSRLFNFISNLLK